MFEFCVAGNEIQEDCCHDFGGIPEVRRRSERDGERGERERIGRERDKKGGSEVEKQTDEEVERHRLIQRHRNKRETQRERERG